MKTQEHKGEWQRRKGEERPKSRPCGAQGKPDASAYQVKWTSLTHIIREN